MRVVFFFLLLIPSLLIAGETPKPDFELDSSKTHAKFSAAIPPVLTVPSGSVIKIQTKEATDGQLNPKSTVEDLAKLDLNRIHPLTGPVFVEGAQPGDVLAVTLHKIELSDWGWTAILPGFGFLADEFKDPRLKHFSIDKKAATAKFDDKAVITLSPFPGVIGVAPDTNDMLSTIPPRANGGNMDDPHMVEGAIVYLPVFVPGGLLSIGDPHAAQGMGEVCGTAIESPLTITYEVNLIKGRKLAEPQYETDDYYATTGFATTIDEAARKATRYMVEYLVDTHKMDADEAYMLCSVAGDLHIAETVDVPNMLVTMHMPKSVFAKKTTRKRPNLKMIP